MDRRQFLRLTGVGMGTLVVPVLGLPVPLSGATTPIPTADRKALAATALDAARSRGASYADVRIGRYLNQFVVTREDKVDSLTNTESYGVGVRVIADGTWGFAATSQVDKDGVAAAAARAVAIAKANARMQQEPVVLGRSRGRRGSWRTPIERRPFAVRWWRRSPAAGGQRRGDGRRRQVVDPASSGHEQKSSLPPTARGSTRTSTASGRPSP